MDTPEAEAASCTPYIFASLTAGGRSWLRQRKSSGLLRKTSREDDPKGTGYVITPVGRTWRSLSVTITDVSESTTIWTDW